MYELKKQPSTYPLEAQQTQAVLNVLQALVDQSAARVLIPANAAESGFWFGGGNMVADEDGNLWLCGRYRNAGDSRTGLEAGARGLECAIFKSTDNGATFTKALSWSKADLSTDARPVTSIEGTALHRLPGGGWELFISSEKDIAYPEGISEFQKPGTGVWTIDRVTGPSPDALDLGTLEPIIENLEEPGYLHVKDPVVYDDAGGNTHLVFCTHPFTWASSNSGVAVRSQADGDFTLAGWEMVSRGPNWDVAVTRITDRLLLPSVGVLKDAPPVSVYFYDGAECMRQLEENPRAARRPRGYSCEEIGGAFVQVGDGPLTRLSMMEPLFISPHGTGCSRYVSTCVTEAGIWVTWQQSQPDQSQPLVGNFLSNEALKALLAQG